MLKSLPVLLSLAIVTGCSQKITVVKARQDKLDSQTFSYKSQPNSSDPAYDGYLSDGLILFRQGEFEKARYFFEQAIGANITGWQAHYYLGLTLCKKQEHSLAQNSFNSSLTYAPNDKRTRSRIYLAMAESWEEQGNLGQAELNYITALNLFPDSSPATAGLKRIERLRRQSRR
jgi:tetratricopeptide (TPR) repeat protein